MSVDFRTRTDGPVAPVDPAGFFAGAVADAFAEHAGLVEPAVRATSPPPLTVAVDGTAHRLVAEGGRVRVEGSNGHGDGERDGGRLRITGEQLTDLAHDQVTPVGWYSNGTLDVTGVGVETLLDWWVLLRGALDGRAPHVAGDVDLVDETGAPLDLARSFRPDDDPDAMRRFLQQAGYLRIAGVYTEDEMAAVSADMDRAAPTYEPGDGRSWWARTGDGTERLVRMQGFDARSERVAELVADDRLHRIGRMVGDGHRWGEKRAGNRIEALVKPLGVVSGLSDLPWHKDCAQGRHSYQCCTLTVGISVTGADASCGQLRVLAGSHRALMWPSFLRDGCDLPAVDLPTRTGDVTVHLSCTLHMAQHPVVRERRVLYTGFGLPPRPGADPAAQQAAVARLTAIREASAVTVSQPADPARPWART
jgi:hypothetical protein